MRFDVELCPVCGSEPHGTIESVSARCELEKLADGTFDYSGGSEIFYDEMKPVEDSEGRVNLICINGHEWFSPVDWAHAPERH